MPVIKHVIEASNQTVTITLTNSLANLSYTAPSTAIDNNTAGSGTVPWLYADFYLTLPSIDPVAGGYVGLYILPALTVANTTYASAVITASGAVSPGEGFLAGVFPLIDTAGIVSSVASNVALPAGRFKVMLGNFAGVAWSSNNAAGALEFRRHNFDVS